MEKLDVSPKLQELWDEKRAAEYLGLNPRTLRNMRSQGRGPKYVKYTSLVRYRIKDLEKFIDESIRDPAA